MPINYELQEEHAKNLKWKKAGRRQAARLAKEAMDDARGYRLPRTEKQNLLNGGSITKDRKTSSLLKTKK